MSTTPLNHSWVHVDSESRTDFDESETKERVQQMEESLPSADIDFYALLNVSRDATDDDIKEAHRRLSRLFHPDKHADPGMHSDAQEQFQRIQRAYEGKVLIDPKQRVIYDNFGESGLRTRWDVGQRFKTVAELRDEFEREAAKRRRDEIEDLVRAKGALSVQIDATKVFSEIVQDRLIANGVQWEPSLEIQQLSMRHSVETEIAPALRLNLAANAIIHSKRSVGNLIGTLRYIHSPQTTFTVSAPLLRSRKLVFKSSYRPTSNSFYNLDTSMTRYSAPSIVVTSGRAFGSGVTGYISVSTGNQYLGAAIPRSKSVPTERSSVTLGVSGARTLFSHNTQVSVSKRQSHLSFSLERKLDANFKLSGGLLIAAAGGPSGLVGLGAVSLNFGGSTKVTDTTNLGWRVNVGFPIGVQVNLTCTHIGQSLSLPIVLSPSPEPDLILFAVALPAIIGAGLHYTIFRPRRRRQLLKRLAELREEHARTLALRQKEAERAVKLMEPTVLRKRAAEEASHGLVINRALYGDFGPSEVSELKVLDVPRAVDVTIPLQSLVTDSKLVLPGGISKSQLIGFYDPSFGKPKKLVVEYTFRDQRHVVTVEDRDPLALPVRGHLLTKSSVSPSTAVPSAAGYSVNSDSVS